LAEGPSKCSVWAKLEALDHDVKSREPIDQIWYFLVTHLANKQNSEGFKTGFVEWKRDFKSDGPR
jgi:hypothetical protein